MGEAHTAAGGSFLPLLAALCVMCNFYYFENAKLALKRLSKALSVKRYGKGDRDRSAARYMRHSGVFLGYRRRLFSVF